MMDCIFAKHGILKYLVALIHIVLRYILIHGHIRTQLCEIKRKLHTLSAAVIVL